jgi:peptidylprolyl isomerase domain and WD repeat-containing protein 1
VCVNIVVNTVTNKVARFLGKDETARFLNLALYQGVPIKKGITTIVRHCYYNPRFIARSIDVPSI